MLAIIRDHLRPVAPVRRRVSSRPALALLALALAAAGSAAARAHAQLPQERGLLERIQHPDLSLAYHPAEKTFGGRGAGPAPWRKAATRTFPFGRRAMVKPYAARSFPGVRGFASGTFAGRDRTTAAGANAPAAAGSDRAFTTRGVVDVREARDARRTLPVRAARVPNFTPVGKRQDALDEQQRTRPMTIEEVRELLNKSR